MTDEMKALNGRERNILTVAQSLLKANIELDEATIDSQFLYRFELPWYRSMSEVRCWIRSLIGEIGDQPLTRDNELHLRWILHINRNKGISVGLDSSKGLTIDNAFTNRQGYTPFNKEWSEQIWALRDDEEAVKRIWAKMWGEANQISKIHSRIFRLGQAYGLIPHDGEFDDYSKNQILELERKVYDWIIWGQVAPVFRWPMTQLLESRLEGIIRTIRPHQWPMGYWKDLPKGGQVRVETNPGGIKRMTPKVRIRTWAVYYLTRRGGGQRTEETAVKLWNRQSPKYEVTKNHFRSERTRLLKQGSLKKSAQNESLYLELAWWGDNR